MVSTCFSHARHWFSLFGCVGARTPVCVRCGAPNPRPLSKDDYGYLRHLLEAGVRANSAVRAAVATAEHDTTEGDTR
jgi:hypothetical protein